MQAQPAPPSTATKARLNHQVVIVGGGNAGISVAARLRRAVSGADIAIVEPSSKHYYQPLWTLVGGGVFDKARSEHSEASVIPKGVVWIEDAVAELVPDQNVVRTRDGREIGYDYLVVAPGIQVNWDAIPGLKDALGTDGVASNYSYQFVDKTWQFLRDFKGGAAIFTQPNTPIKCAGAPQKIAYLADDQFRKAGVRDKSEIIFALAGTSVFGVEKYRKTLEQVIARKGIDVRFKHNLIELRPATKEAVFELVDSGGEKVALHYDFIHVTPPMSAPDFIRNSPLANEAGWVAADKFTLQHPKFPNVFTLGDAAGLPTGKTGAAIRKQAPVVVANLAALVDDRPLPAQYDGYTACPVVTGYNKLVMAEFDYDLKPRESFPFDQSKERRSMYLVKKWALPALYWRAILKGRA